MKTFIEMLPDHKEFLKKRIAAARRERDQIRVNHVGHEERELERLQDELDEAQHALDEAEGELEKDEDYAKLTAEIDSIESEWKRLSMYKEAKK